jgi:TRAP-type C4-dicarboxylate transport system substrate-binding protein
MQVNTAIVKLLFAALAIAALSATSGAVAQERLLFTSLSPAGSSNSVFFNAWAKRVNEQSNGALQIEVRDGVTLANYANVYDRVQDDVVQIGWAIHQVIAGKFPLSEVGGLPFVSAGGTEASIALWRMNKAGLFAAEYQDVVPLVFVVFGPSQLHYAKVPRSTEDLANLKIGVQGRVQSQLIGQLSGTPISMQPGDMYEALQRGTVDASIISWSGFAPYKLQEVTSFHIEVPLGQSTSMFFMSRKRYDTLSPAARKALETVMGEDTTREFMAHFMKQWNDARSPVAADPKHKIVQLDGAPLERWQKAAVPIVADWAKSRANGEKALETYRDLYAQAKTR